MMSVVGDLADSVVRCVRFGFYLLRAYFSSGGGVLCRVSSWDGPPVPGRPGVGQLCMLDVRTLIGERYLCLSRGGARVDMSALDRDTSAASTHVLDATLTSVAHDGAQTHTTVTELVYHIPIGCDVSVRELAALVHGTRSWTRTATCSLTITTLSDNAYTCFDDGIVDARWPAPPDGVDR